MKRIHVGIVLVVIVVLGGALLANLRPQEQPFSSGSAPPGMPSQGREAPDFRVMAKNQIAHSLSIPDDERLAMEVAVDEKLAARAALSSEALILHQVAIDAGSSDEEIAAALDQYQEAERAFRDRVREIDDELIQQISPRTRAKLTTSGVLENSLNFLSTRSPLQAMVPPSRSPGPSSPDAFARTSEPTIGRASGVSDVDAD